MTFKQRLNLFFREIRKKGYFAEQNFWCCRTCAWADLDDEQSKKAVFYTEQNTVKEGKEQYIYWNGKGSIIRQTAEDCGFVVEWDGSENTAILLKNPSDKDANTSRI